MSEEEKREEELPIGEAEEKAAEPADAAPGESAPPAEAAKKDAPSVEVPVEVVKEKEVATSEAEKAPAENPPEPAPAEAAPVAEAQPGASAESGNAAPPAKPEEAAPAPAAEAPVRRKETDEEKAARRKAALEAREAAKVAAAQAAAKASAPAASEAPGQGVAASGGEEAAPPPPPSPNQPRLDRAVQLLRELVAEDAVEEALINKINDHLPTIVVKGERWLAAARLFRSHPELKTNYLRNVSGVDHETHMEVVYHLLSMDSGHVYAVKVRTDREQPRVPSATPVWQTANWNEREIYDLLGVDFPGHPDLRRIMMPDDWVGHPLRKDYVPLDSEV